MHPLADAGPTTEGNLALACVSCSLKKGARIAAQDPMTQRSVRLFNPRRDRWSDHFRWDGPVVVPLSEVGRATAALLDMNRALVVAIRVEEGHLGRHPPT